MPQPDLENRTVLTQGQEKALWQAALRRYCGEVQNGNFPNDEESYHLQRDSEEFFK